MLKSTSAFHLKSLILWVNKLNTRSKKKKRFGGTLNNSAQKVPEVLTLNFRQCFNLQCITLAGPRDSFLVSVTTHGGLYPFNKSRFSFRFSFCFNIKLSEYSSPKKIHSTPSICYLEIDTVYL